MKIFWLLLAVVACTATVHATPLEDKVKAFNAAVRANMPKTPGSNPYMGERFFPVIEAQASPEAENNVEQTVRQIMGAQTAADVQKAGQDVLDEIKAQRKARTDALKVKADAVLARVPDAVAKATKPADLDAVLNDIQEAEQGQRSYGYGGGEEYQAISNRLTSIYQFVASWQDFLSQRTNGNIQEAISTLRNLQNQRVPGDAIVPRSQILDLLNTMQARQNSSAPSGQPHNPDINPILDGIKTLDDLSLAVRNLAANGNYNEPYEIVQLKHYDFMYEQAKNGMPVTLESSPQNYGVMTPQPGFARIASLVYAYILPRFLGSSAPAQNANEATNDYLDRVITTAETAQDWQLLQRAITAKIRIGQNRSQNQGVQAFTAGINQEIAGQYVLAISSYQNALKSADEYTPAKVIGDRLTAIHKDHPTEYDEAMKRYLNPPPPVYPAGAFATPYGYPQGYRPGMPGATSGTPAPPPAAVPKLSPPTNSAPANPPAK